MGKRIRNILLVLGVFLLLPYVITILFHGESMERNRGNEQTYLHIKTEKGTRSVRLDDYCIGMLAKEMPVDYAKEALKAQAILVRTTVYKKVEEEGEDAVLDEPYFSKKEMKNLWGRKHFEKYYKKVADAWKETKGQVVLYDEKLATVPFHRLSNGKTRVGAELLGSDSYPYLVSKDCPKDVEADGHMETRLIRAEQAQVKSQDSAGYVTEVQVGEKTVGGEQFRKQYGLLSSCFELQEFEGKMRVVTKGIGHGLGMSQNTANEMAKDGKTCEEILAYFFEGTELKEVAEILLDVE